MQFNARNQVYTRFSNRCMRRMWGQITGGGYLGRYFQEKNLNKFYEYGRK